MTWYDDAGESALPRFGSRDRLPPTPLADHVRSRLFALLADDRPAAAALLFRLHRLGEREGVPAFSAALRHLAQLELPEPEAESALRAVLEHRRRLREALGRDPGVRVSLLDSLEHGSRPRQHLGPRDAPFLEEAVAREIRRSRRYPQSFSLILLGIGGFAAIPASAGVLLERAVRDALAAMLRRELRESDRACCERLGTIGAVLPRTGREDAARVAGRIGREVLRVLDRASALDAWGEKTVSAVICCYPADARSAASMLSRARESLARAQGTGERLCAAPHERRSFRRHAVDGSVRAWIRAAPDEPEATARLCDLSRAGALLEAAARLPGGGLVQLRLERRGRPTEPEWGTAARVVRSQPTTRDARASRIAVEFDPTGVPAWLESGAAGSSAGGPSEGAAP